MQVDDGLLVQRAQRGERAAIEALLKAYEKNVYNIAYRFMGNEADAYDMAQDALIKIYKGIASFKGQASFSSWVYRLTVNACMDGLRKRKNTPVSLENAVESGVPFEDPGAASPESYTLSIERKEDIQKAINLLPDVQKAAIILRDVYGFSYEEVSDYLDISVGTVKSRINRGRQKLRELLVE